MSDTPSLLALSPQAMVEAAEHHVMDKASKKFTRRVNDKLCKHH